MSDLAPLVVATIHDKVLLDLLEENKKLKEHLRVCHKIEITGPEGSPVYARADIGKDGTYHHNANLWEVTVPEQEMQQPPVLQQCKLENLLDLEIRIGGILNRSLKNNQFECFLTSTSDEDVIILMCFGEPTAWFKFEVRGWDEDCRWDDNFLDGDDGTRAYMNEEETFMDLIHFASEECPDAIVTFCSFTPTVKSMRDIISTLPQAHDKELQKRVQEYHHDQSIRSVIRDFLRDNTNVQPKKHVFDSIVAILCRKGLVNDPSNLDAIWHAVNSSSHDVLKEISELLLTTQQQVVSI